MMQSALFHQNVLITILKDIFKNEALAPFLGFKGGTAAMFFYELPRFSVDLDFDLLNDPPVQLIFDEVEKIIEKYGVIKKADNKRYTLFFLLSYEGKQKGASNIKVEISKRKFNSQYQILNLLGIPMRVMVKSDMAAHKLMAMRNRLGRANRDIYDTWFFLQNQWPINSGIIELLMKMSYKDFLEETVLALKKYDDRQILTGLGELLSEEQRKWVQKNLKDETVFLLKLYGRNAR
jgi:predicted nucleotidyltransferase component of viral defense system